MIYDPDDLSVAPRASAGPADSPLDAITIPLPAAAPAEGLRDAPLVGRVRVLLVDDAPVNRDIVAAFLRAAGHAATCVKSGLEAVEAVAINDFDIVLMDLRMPEMDGLEATRRIRALEGPRGQVPIIALTARDAPEQILECRKAGMNGHLVKSFDLDTLLATAVEMAGARPLLRWQRPE